MTQEEFSLLFHRAKVNYVAFKMLYEPEAFEAMHRMVEMAIAEEREACAKVCEALRPFGPELALQKATAEDCAASIRARGQK